MRCDFVFGFPATEANFLQDVSYKGPVFVMIDDVLPYAFNCVCFVYSYFVIYIIYSILLLISTIYM